MSFAGFINALSGVPPGSFVWNDIIAINQHGDAGPLARKAMVADLASLESVIKHTKRIVLYFDPIEDPAPVKRVWCAEHSFRPYCHCSSSLLCAPIASVLAITGVCTRS